MRSLPACLLAGICLLFNSISSFASCGSTSCPLDLNSLNRPDAGRFALDLSFQSIDQEQPRIGTRKAHVGELHSAEHDEISTTNRSATLLLRYAVAPSLEVSASTGYVRREHEHRDERATIERWNIHGLGDLQLQARKRIGDGLWAIAGVKLPTGNHSRTNGEGEAAEVPIQPGTGSTDWIAGLSYERGFVHAAGVRGPMGNMAVIPFFATLTVRRNGEGASHYRFGNEWQLHAGTAYAVHRSIELLAQLNGRVRGRDRNPELDGALDPFTGSSALFVSPGIRVSAGAAACYALVQIPVAQRVNGLQLTASRNWIGGLQLRF